MTDAGHHDLVIVTGRLPAEPPGAARRPSRWTGEHAAWAAALQPGLTMNGGAWIGWHGVAGPPVPPTCLQSVSLRAVPLSDAEIADHFEGQCASTIAPLYHDGAERAAFHRRWRRAYRIVNERFAAEAAAAAAPNAGIWVHGHDLQLVPALLRAERPDLRIAFYLPLPVPPAELFRRMPMRAELLDGMLGADTVLLPDRRSAENFRRLAAGIGGYRLDDGRVLTADRRVMVGTLPMGADARLVAQLATGSNVARRVETLRRELRAPRVVLLAVDALDAMAGTEQRLGAYSELLADGKLPADDCTLVQVVIPGPRPTDEQDRLRGRVEQLIARINGMHSTVGRPAVHYVHRQLDRVDTVALFRLADVLLATPLREGTSLVAKEYVAARSNDTGVVVLSEFSGTAEELMQARLVNPYDVEDIKRAILTAVEPGHDARPAMHEMRTSVLRYDVHWWAATALAMLSR
ncbi:alpha,alpha-trehalose-phosphate synthase (UDP-forming) [Dactylosporangium sp. CA-092794]|uniref:alpha,alpha-trehalose-phosphate synthase (UDP-forming) n=1 Tax=Dactylosporangium sp. CA-092794 TaxID=3239929 RepID=UPI003D8F27BB